MQLQYFHLDRPAVWQALAVLLEQFGLHVGIFDNNLRVSSHCLPRPRNEGRVSYPGTG